MQNDNMINGLNQSFDNLSVEQVDMLYNDVVESGYVLLAGKCPAGYNYIGGKCCEGWDSSDSGCFYP